MKVKLVSQELESKEVCQTLIKNQNKPSFLSSNNSKPMKHLKFFTLRLFEYVIKQLILVKR